MDTHQRLVVVTHRAWLADTFASVDLLPVVHDHGFDAPAGDPAGPAWWMPMQHAACLLRAGVPLTLSATGSAWLSGVPRSLTRRDVWAGTLHDYAAGAGPDAGWGKPAEAKVEALPAAWRSRAELIDAAATAGLPDDAMLLVCPQRLDLVEEHRAFVRDGQVLTTTPYLDGGGNTWDEAWASRQDFDNAAARAFAQQVADTVPLPRGIVLDVALDRDRGWLLLEANPAWASNPYGADPAAVMRTVLAANSPDPDWVWVPDPVLVYGAARRRPLPVSRPSWLTS